jgi:predicted nucleotidyltransferase
MRIRRNEPVAGIDSLKLRKFLRNTVHRDTSYMTAMNEFSVTALKAKKLIAKLLELKLICPCKVQKDNEPTYYENTMQGNGLAFAKAGKAVSRATADRVLRDFLDRVTTVTRRKELAFSVESVVVFGSYLSDAERFNDLDIAVELKPRWDDSTPEGVRKSSTDRATVAGRHFHDFMDLLAWPENEVMLILKNRSRTITFYEFDSLFEMEGLRYCVVIGNKKRIATLIAHGRPVERLPRPKSIVRG